MAVNSELENLDEVLPKAFALLKPGGRLLVITFHSGEEIVVVGFMRKMQKLGEAKLIGGPNVAQEEEIRTNPRARSAKLYILEKQ
jgi:16S rRNA (cytosine1402-N4)-methyltransferase